MSAKNSEEICENKEGVNPNGVGNFNTGGQNTGDKDSGRGDYPWGAPIFFFFFCPMPILVPPRRQSAPVFCENGGGT